KDDNAPLRGGVNRDAGAVYTALFFDPTQPVREDDGTFFESDHLTLSNPVSLIEGEENTSQRNLMTGNIFSEYSISPSLSARLNLGFDVRNVRDDLYRSRLTQ